MALEEGDEDWNDHRGRGKNRYEAVLKIKFYPVRSANSKEEFIENYIEEFNNLCGDIVDIDSTDFKEIKEYEGMCDE